MTTVSNPADGKEGRMRTRNRNEGLRKRCDCKRKDWPRCPHSWYLNFKAKNGPHYRLSLDREVGRHIDSKSTAIAEAERIRTAIRNGAFRPDACVIACARARPDVPGVCGGVESASRMPARERAGRHLSAGDNLRVHIAGHRARDDARRQVARRDHDR